MRIPSEVAAVLVGPTEVALSDILKPSMVVVPDRRSRLLLSVVMEVLLEACG